MQVSESIDKWTAGMIAFRKELQQPSKNAKNDFLKNSYVTLEGILNAADDAIKKIAENNGIVFSQDVKSNAATNVISVTTLVSHVSGQYVIYGPFDVPAGKKNDAQAYGSSTTYAKRYALAAALGIASDLDDDAEGTINRQDHSQNNARQDKPKPKTITRSEIGVLEDMVTQLSDETGVNRGKLLNVIFENCGITKFSGITIQQRDKAKKVIDTLSDRYKQKQIDAQQKQMESKEAVNA